MEPIFIGLLEGNINLDLGGDKRYTVDLDILEMTKGLIRPNAHRLLLLLMDSTGSIPKPLENSKSGGYFITTTEQLEDNSDVHYRYLDWHAMPGTKSNQPNTTDLKLQ